MEDPLIQLFKSILRRKFRHTTMPIKNRTQEYYCFTKDCS